MQKIMSLSAIGDKVTSLRVRTVILITLLFSLMIIGYKYFYQAPPYKEYVKNQWYNFYLIDGPFSSAKAKLILFDTEVLPKVFKPRAEVWHDPAYTCRVLCKHHPEEKNIISFAVMARKFIPFQEKLLKKLSRVGFSLHMSMVDDPRLHDAKNKLQIPSHLWIARKNHLIQISFLHERAGDYYWIGAIPDHDWLAASKSLEPALGKNWDSLDVIGAKFPRYSQAFDMSHHMIGTPTKIDSHNIIVPFHIDLFMKEFRNSRFIECNHAQAEEYHRQFPQSPTPVEKEYQRNAVRLLNRTKKVFDKLRIPFWLSSGTLLGYFRECGIIPHGLDVDIGVWIRDYKEELMEAMERYGLMLKHKFGEIEDSFELSFVEEHNVKLDIFFFYEEYDHVWNGGTRAYDGAKYKYKFPKFSLCWTEFMQLKVRVPCETLSYIEANYGLGWYKPVKDWVWYMSPPNVEPNGYWDKAVWDDAIQVYQRNKEKRKGDETH